MALSSETIISWRLPVGLVAQAMINTANTNRVRYRFFISVTFEASALLPLLIGQRVLAFPETVNGDEMFTGYGMAKT